MGKMFSWLDKRAHEDIEAYDRRINASKALHGGYAFLTWDNYDESLGVFSAYVVWNGDLNRRLRHPLPQGGFMFSCPKDRAAEICEANRALPVFIKLYSVNAKVYAESFYIPDEDRNYDFYFNGCEVHVPEWWMVFAGMQQPADGHYEEEVETFDNILPQTPFTDAGGSTSSYKALGNTSCNALRSTSYNASGNTSYSVSNLSSYRGSASSYRAYSRTSYKGSVSSYSAYSLSSYRGSVSSYNAFSHTSYKGSGFGMGSYNYGSFLRSTFSLSSYYGGRYRFGGFMSENSASWAFLSGSFYSGSYASTGFLSGSFSSGSYTYGSFLFGSFFSSSYLSGSYLSGSYRSANRYGSRYLSGSYSAEMPEDLAIGEASVQGTEGVSEAYAPVEAAEVAPVRWIAEMGYGIGLI